MQRDATSTKRVLIVTGGFLTVKDRSIYHALKRQIAAVKASSAPWYDLHLKAVAAGELLPLRRHLKSLALRLAPYRQTVLDYFTDDRIFEAPELSEVLLATLLEAEGIAWEASTFTELLTDAEHRERLLQRCSCIFACTTMLRDLSEMDPLIRALKRPHNRIVAGGALVSLLGASWQGDIPLDLLAVGHGELLVPAIATWIRSGFSELVPPPRGRLEHHGGVPVMFSGVPDDRSLDALPPPDWRLAERCHGRRYPMVHYESVRGCPFRCTFCSFPYLFGDTRVRYKSAGRVAEDWANYAARGARFINCLDSNFTVPKKRLVQLCERLIDLGSPVRWICYARGSELADEQICWLMQRAGCHQVQIGVESANPQILANMNKRCSVEDNARALVNCRRAGICSFVTLIVGFPGETPTTVRENLDFLRETGPDFAYGSPFITRVEAVPVLSAASRDRFGLQTTGGSRSSSPYWRHRTMSCEEVGHWQRWLHRKMMLERISLQATLFYQGMLDYRRSMRDDLLDFQYHAATDHPLLAGLLGGLSLWTQGRLRRDVDRALVGA